MTRHYRVIIPTLLAISAVAARGETPPSAPPVGPAIAAASTRFAAVSQLVAFADGSILVNDIAARILYRLDQSLAATVVLDSSATARESHPGVRSFLLPFRGDSALFFDGRASTLVEEERG